MKIAFIVFSALVLLVSTVIAACAFYAQPPHYFWLSRILSGITNTEKCVREWNYQDLSKIDFSDIRSMPQKLIGPVLNMHAHNWKHVMTGGIDGGEGNDTLAYAGGNIIVADGETIKSVENIYIKNQKTNIIYLLAPSLVSLENKKISIDADPEAEKYGDVIELDGCLHVGFPSINNSKSTFPLYDRNNDIRYLEISNGTLLRSIHQTRINRWFTFMKQKQANPDKPITFHFPGKGQDGITW